MAPDQQPPTVPPGDPPLWSAAYVRAYRVARGWSVYRLAQESGVDRATIGRVEDGATEGVHLRPATVGRLAAALGVDMWELWVLPPAVAARFAQAPPPRGADDDDDEEQAAPKVKAPAKAPAKAAPKPPKAPTGSTTTTTARPPVSQETGEQSLLRLMLDKQPLRTVRSGDAAATRALVQAADDAARQVVQPADHDRGVEWVLRAWVGKLPGSVSDLDRQRLLREALAVAADRGDDDAALHTDPPLDPE